jgi:hypothetical protein
MKAHPDLKITINNFVINATDKANTDGLWEAYAYMNKQFPMLSENGVMGYYYIYPSYISAIFLNTGKSVGTEATNKLWNPILDKMLAFPGVIKTKQTVIEYDSYKSYFDARFGPIDKPTHKKRHEPGMTMNSAPTPQGIAPLDSRLLGADAFNPPNLTALLRAAAPKYSAGTTSGSLQGHLIGGGKVFKPDDDTSVLPAWRKAYVHAITYRQLDEPGANSLRTLAPDMGSYANEVRI